MNTLYFEIRIDYDESREEVIGSNSLRPDYNYDYEIKQIEVNGKELPNYIKSRFLGTLGEDLIRWELARSRP